MKRTPFKKKDGNIGDLIATMVCLLFIITIMFGMVSFMKIISVKRDVQTISKSALLTLESQGGLTSADINALYDGLHNNFSDVAVYVNGSLVSYGNKSSIAYNGETVSIEIKIKATPTELGLTAIWGAFTDDYEISSKLSSISKTQKKEA